MNDPVTQASTTTGAFTPAKGFKGLWLPACILFDSELALIQKVILSEIYYLQQNGECFAGNAHFCSMVGCKPRNLRDHLRALENAGLLVRHLHRNGRNIKVAPFIGEMIKAQSQEPISARLRPPRDDHSNVEIHECNNTLSSEGDVVIAELNQSAVHCQGGGSLNIEQADECRPPRQPIATEITMREQLQNTNQNTKHKASRAEAHSGAVSIDSSNYAGTHLLGDDGAKLVSLEAWHRWMSLYDPSRDAEALTEDKQLEKLNEMVKLGFNGEDLLRAAIRSRDVNFWSSPAYYLIPKDLRERW